MNMIGKTIVVSLCALVSASCGGYVEASYTEPTVIYGSAWGGEKLGVFSINADKDYFTLAFDLKKAITTTVRFDSITLRGNFIREKEGLEERQQGEILCRVLEMSVPDDGIQSLYQGFDYEGKVYKGRRHSITFHPGRNELRTPLYSENWRMLLDESFRATFHLRSQNYGATLLGDGFFWKHIPFRSAPAYFYYIYEGTASPSGSESPDLK